MIGEQPQPDLFQVVQALDAAARFPGRLHGGQQEPDEHADDRDHHEKLGQRERTAS